MAKFNATHHGLMYKCVPVLIDFKDPACPEILIRGGAIGNIYFKAVSYFYESLQTFARTINPDYVDKYTITLLRKA